MALLRLQCPVGHSSALRYPSPYTTKNDGDCGLDTCAPGPVSGSETKQPLLEGWQTPVRVRWHVRQARPEGRGFPAAARTLEQAQTTLLAWASQGGARPRVLGLSAVGHAL